MSNSNVTCPICSGRRLRALQEHASEGSPQPYRLFECAACKVQHWQPLIHPERDYYENESMAMYAMMHEGQRDVRDPRFLKFLSEFGTAPAGRMLDVGCSDGVLLQRMSESGHDVWGLDIDRKALEAARRRGLTNVHCMGVDEFIEKARAEGVSFSIITLFDVVEHLVDPLRTMRGLCSLLERGGRIVGTVPNRNRVLADYVKSDFPPHHFLRFDAQSLSSFLQHAGLFTEKVDVFQYGYSVNTALGALLGKGSRSSRSVAGRPSAAARPAGRRRKLRRAMGSAFLSALAIPSYLIERPRQRGFKLYFVARNGTARIS